MPDDIDALVAEARTFARAVADPTFKLPVMTRPAHLVMRELADALSAARAVIEEAKVRLHAPIHPYGDEQFDVVPEIEFMRSAYGDTGDDLLAILSKFPSGETAPLPEFGATATAAESPKAQSRPEGEDE